MDHFQLKDGILHAEDVPLTAIAEAAGTPTYIYSSATLERHVRVFRDGLAIPDAWIAFAVKANPNKAVLATLARLGLGADVVSGGELLRARWRQECPRRRLSFRASARPPRRWRSASSPE